MNVVLNMLQVTSKDKRMTSGTCKTSTRELFLRKIVMTLSRYLFSEKNSIVAIWQAPDVILPTHFDINNIFSTTFSVLSTVSIYNFEKVFGCLSVMSFWCVHRKLSLFFIHFSLSLEFDLASTHPESSIKMLKVHVLRISYVIDLQINWKWILLWRFWQNFRTFRGIIYRFPESFWMIVF